MAQEKKIEFINVGMPRSGTTWLASLLGQHPKIFIPKEKDLFFWGPASYTHVHSNCTSNYAKGVSWYMGKFKDARTDQLLGEIGTQYADHEEAAKQIKGYNPDIKLLLTLRNPTERLFSDYKKALYKYKLPPLETLGEDNWLYKSGCYDVFLKTYFEQFDRRNIHIVLFEDLMQHTEDTLKCIFEFLGVDRNMQVELSLEKRNESTKHVAYDKYFVPLARALKKNALLKKTAPLLKEIGVHTALQKILTLFQSTKERFRKQDISETELRAKIDAYYRPHIDALESMVSIDLTKWKT